jgi:hypothetical protein
MASVSLEQCALTSQDLTGYQKLRDFPRPPVLGLFILWMEDDVAIHPVHVKRIIGGEGAGRSRGGTQPQALTQLASSPPARRGGGGGAAPPPAPGFP